MHVVRQRLPAAFAHDARDARALPLDHASRKRTRQRIAFDGGEIALALPPGESLQSGDVLVADDGTRWRVVARDEPVLRVRGDAWALARAAYHLGNRHVPVAVLPDELRLEPDAVLREMLERLGVAVDEIVAPFEPEHGAYGGGHRHGHDETFADDYALAQAVFVRRAAGDA